VLQRERKHKALRRPGPCERLGRAASAVGRAHRGRGEQQARNDEEDRENLRDARRDNNAPEAAGPARPDLSAQEHENRQGAKAEQAQRRLAPPAVKVPHRHHPG
jgi:hypothetical protein